HALMVDLLVKAGADPRTTSTTGATPLMLAAGAGSAEAVQVLIEHGGDVNAKESGRGETALMFAASANRASAIKVLMQHGADPKIASKVIDVAAIGKAEAAERAKSGRGGSGLSDDPDAPAESGRGGSRGQASADKKDASGTKSGPPTTQETKPTAAEGTKPAS